jgi:hypothetical protein
MALPTLDAVFASAADQPRRMMLAKWLVEELGSGAIADYYDLPERYLWAKIAVAAGAPRSEADYISLPKNYVWSDIYNAVSGDIAESTVVVSGLGDTQYNGRYVYDGDVNGRPSYRLNEDVAILWGGVEWVLEDLQSGDNTLSPSDVSYPWMATGWINEGIDPTGIVLTPETPNHTDWHEKQALGHIAAAYRGDTANPANLATYIDWPWRYQVASIIDHLLGNYNAVIVSGAGTASSDGTYVLSGQQAGKGVYEKGSSQIVWSGGVWLIEDVDFGDFTYQSNDDTQFPWNANFFTLNGDEPAPTLTPTNV